MIRARWVVAGLGILGGLALGGCHASGSANPPVPGTHESATVYRISSPVSTVVVTGHVGDVTVTGGRGSSTTVTEQVTYSKTPPVTSRTISGKTLTVSYTCAAQVVCAVSYVVQVPRDVAVRAQTGAGKIRLAGLAGSVTAKAKAGIIDATGLSGASVSLTTYAGGITASFTAAPATLQAVAHVGAVILHLPGTTAYKVSANARVGHAQVGVRQDSSSGHAITATTDVGAITIST